MITVNPSQKAVESIVEPLCKATAGLFEPLLFGSNDYLMLSLDDDAERFEMSFSCMRPVEQGKCKYCEKSKDEHVLGMHEFTLVESTEYNGRHFQLLYMQPQPNAIRRFIERIPEKRPQGGAHENKWLVAGTDFSVLIIHHVWPADQIIFKTPHTQLLYEFLLKRFLFQTRASKISAEFKINGAIPAMPVDFIEHPEFPPLPFQRVPIAMFTHQEASALFMEQGTGKTPTVINRVNLEAPRKFTGVTAGVDKGMYRVLVICPNQVRYNWTLEVEKFATVPGKVTILRGDVLNRNRLLIDAVREEPDCIFSMAIIGIDSVASNLEMLKMVPFDLVVVDESHYAKSRRSNRWAALIELRDAPLPGGSRQRMILTGTPIANTVFDLWAQLEFLGKGMSGFMAYENFKKFYGKWVRIYNGNGIEKLEGLTNVPLLQERLARLSFLIKKEEAGLNLPDLTESVIEIEMTLPQAEYYKKVRDALALEIEHEKQELGKQGKRLHASHVLTKLLRLAQITSGFIRWDEEIDPDTGIVTRDGYSEPIPGNNPKLDAMIDMLKVEDRDPRAKTIIWSCFRASIGMITARLEEEGIKYVEYWGATSEQERLKAVHYFNSDPSIKVFVGNPQTAGAGLNLLGYDPTDPELFDTYTDWEFVFDQGWSAVLRSQALARAHRKGTRYPVQVFDFMVPGTIDEEIRKRVRQKIDIADAIQDIRVVLRNVLDLEID